jgi:chloride channel 2
MERAEPMSSGVFTGLHRDNGAIQGDLEAPDDHSRISPVDRAPRDARTTSVSDTTATLKRRNSAARSLSPPMNRQQTGERLSSLDLDPDFAADIASLQFPGNETDIGSDARTLSDSDAASVSRFGGPRGRSDDEANTTLWTRLRGVFMRSQPGFYDLQDPVRRKQQGETRKHRRRETGTARGYLTPATAHLPYRYHSLLLSDAEDHLPTDIDDVDLLHLLSAEREQLATLTVSVFESTWVFLLLLGVLASLTAWTVDGAVLVVTDLHARVTQLGGAWVPDYLLYTAFRVVILLLGVTCTYVVCPNAAGSGIPEMRSILGGFPFPNYLRMRTLIAKSVGLVLALGSALSIGKEGPFVHLSCIIAHQLLRLPLFQQIRRSQDLTHHVLAAACAVGVTATFGTPVGGVLFSIEVTTTYYVTSNYWRAFFSSVVGVVVFRQLNSLLSGNNVSLFTTKFDVLPYKSYEMIFFLLLAALCGLLAAAFVKLYRVVVDAKTALLERYVFARVGGARPFEPFVYAAFVALTFALIEFPVGSFMRLSQREIIDDMFSEGNLTATDDDPTHLYANFQSQWTSPSLALNLLWYIGVRFVETAISATVMVPSGIVTPVFAIGAAFGRLFGEMIVFLGGGNELAGGYAVVGAASFTAGITGTISIAVIVFELTSQLSYMVPVLLCVLVGRGVALLFSLDMYDTIGRQKNLPQWPDLTKQKSYGLVASDLMRGRPSYAVLRCQTLASLQKVLETAPPEISVFPVVDNAETMIYLGVADREELEVIVEQWQLCLSRASSSSRSSHGSTGSGTRGFPITVTAGIPDADRDESITPRSREVEMSSNLALAGVSSAQGAAFSNPASESLTPVDLVSLSVLSLDSVNFHVNRDTYASQVILLISVHKSPQLFVTARGRLIGVIHAADLLARSRRYTL